MTTSAFSSNESTAIERTIELDDKQTIKSLSDIWSPDRLYECTSWIRSNNYQRICLQFPDNLLAYSSKIFDDLQRESNANIFILGDTSYGSCCVDETAAAHISADSIIHFGDACLSKTSRLPVFYVFPHYRLSISCFVNAFHKQFPDINEKFIIFYHIGYYYDLEAIKLALNKDYKYISYGKLALNNDDNSTLGWQCNTDTLDLNEQIKDCTSLYLGPDDQTFFSLSLTLQSDRWFLCDPNLPTISFKSITTPMQTTWMRRRYFNIEKCKDAKSLGIVVATLTSNNYLDAVKHIQLLANKRDIRTYIISVGKINPAKLANFMEIDCFVIIGCPLNNIYVSREFYKPLVSVFEIEMALNPAWYETLPDSYAVDFREILSGGKSYREYDETNLIENDVSLVTGNVRIKQSTVNESEQHLPVDKQLQERKNHELMLSGSSGSFQNRSWTGLEPALGQTEPAKIQQGRSGIAIKYDDDYKNEMK